jgi:gamma-glutamylputrescine oxidase
MTVALEATPPVWADCPALDLPSLDGDAEADVCVVGLGGSGLAAARALRAMGKSVIGLDAGEVAGGAAGSNGGFLLAGLYEFHHDAAAKIGRERARRLYELTIAEIARIAAETPEAVRLVGSLRVGVSPEELDDCAAQLDAMRADALPVEPYDGPEGRGLLVPTDGAMQPLRRARALGRLASEEGARLFERSPAVEITSGEVRTPAGRVRCRGVVVAVDGSLDRVLPELAPRVRTARLQMLATAPAPEVRFPRPVYARWGYDYWQQLPDGAIALGGARDVGGETEWTHDARPTPAVQYALELVLRGPLKVSAPVVRRWAALVSYSDTGLPLLEEVRPGVWACGAYSGTGNVLGALCGRAAASFAAGAPGPGARELLALLDG